MLFKLVLICCLIGLTSSKIEQVHISYLEGGKMMVMWLTTNPLNSQVQFGSHPSNLHKTASGKSSNYSHQGYTSPLIFQAVMDNLDPSVVYYYRVGGSSWSTIYEFQSAPAVGTPGIIVGAIGDVGTDIYSNQTLQGLIRMRERKGLDIVIHAGDLSYANNYHPGGPVWDAYGKILEPLAAYTPYNPCVGNHEVVNNFIDFKERYGVPLMEKHSGGGDFYWSFDYGFIHFVMLSSETNYAYDSPQHRWLQKDLQSVDRMITPWIIASWHRPWYNSNSDHHNEGEAMRKTIEDTIHKYNVDIVFLGHIHAYERTYEVYNGNRKAGATVYVTVGNGGTPEGLAKHWAKRPDWSAFRISEWGYTRLHAYNATHAHLTMRGDSDNKMLDDAWIIRKR